MFNYKSKSFIIKKAIFIFKILKIILIFTIKRKKKEKIQIRINSFNKIKNIKQLKN